MSASHLQASITRQVHRSLFILGAAATTVACRVTSHSLPIPSAPAGNSTTPAKNSLDARSRPVFTTGTAQYQLNVSSTIDAATNGSLQQGSVRTLAFITSTISESTGGLQLLTNVDSFSVVENERIPKDTASAYAASFRALLDPTGVFRIPPNRRTTVYSADTPAVVGWLE